MEYAKLGDSDLEVSRVILGTWVTGGWMWGGVEDRQSIDAIRKAIDCGITTIDTAPIYGFGHSERIVGEAIKGRRDQVTIATKCGLRWDRDDGERFLQTERPDGTPATICKNLKRDAILEEIDLSLERLGVDYVDLYQCHWPDSTTPISETMGAMNEVLASGKARAVGVSNFPVEMIAESHTMSAIVSEQSLYNMLDRAIEAEVLPYCYESGIGVIVYSSLHQGLLTGKVDMDRAFPDGDQRQWRPWFRPENRKLALEFLDKVRPIADAHGRTLGQVAVNWCLCQPGVTAALVGARRPEQVEENAGGAGWSLSDDELAAIRGWLDELPEVSGVDPRK